MSGGLNLTLLRVEGARFLREPRLRWLAALAPLLLLTVFLSSWHGAAQLARERQQFTQAERARWLAQGAKDPHSAAHFGVWAVKPASPLAALAPGIEPFVGLSVWLEAHKRNEMILRPNQDADPVMRAATSVAQLIELLGPVFAILLGFAGFAQDRQRGTLRTALGNGATPARLLLVRLAVMAAVLLATVLAPAAIMGMFALSALPAAGWDGWARLAVWIALHFVYLSVFLLMALTVSLKAPSARAALAVTMALWLAFCVLLPRAAGNGARLVSPVPSYQAVRNQAEREAPAYEKADQWEARRVALARKYGAKADLRAAQLDQSERESHAVFDRLLGRFYDAVERQDRVFGWFGASSPAVALQAAGAGIAGTDFHQHRHFIDAAEAYRRAMVNHLNGDLMHQAEHDSGAVNQPRAWDATPEFKYRPPPLQDVMADIAPPLVLLFGWFAVAGAAAWSATRGVRP